MLSISTDLPFDELPEDLKLLLSNPSENQEQIINYLTAQDQRGYSFIINAVMRDLNPEIRNEQSAVEAILSSLKTYPEILSQVLLKEFQIGDNNSMTLPYLVFIMEKPEIFEKILLSLQTHPEILREVLMKKNEFGNSVFIQALGDLKDFEFVEKILSSLQTNPEVLRQVVLMQVGKFNDSALNLLFLRGEAEKAEKILSSLQTHPDILKEVLMQKNNSGSSVLIKAIDSQKPEIVEKILSSLQTHPDILKEVLMHKNNSGNSVLIKAIDSKKPEIVEEILSSLQTHPDILCQVLKQVDKNNLSALHGVILVDNSEITEKILSSLQAHPKILREVLMQKNNYCNSALYHAIFKENLHIVKNILSSLQTHPDFLKEVLMQKNNSGSSVLIKAIDSQKPEIVEEILSSLQTHPDILKEVLMQKDDSGDKALFKAIQNVVANNYENTKPEEILKLLVDNQFKNIHIDQEKILVLTSFYKNHALLALMSQGRYGIGSKKTPHFLTKILNEVVASSERKALRENPISEIYASQIPKVNSNQPINIDANQALYIYKSNVLEHNSYVIFNVEQATNKLKSISYCDGNFFPGLGDERPHPDSLLSPRTFGVREFELKEDHEFSAEFAQEFIKENFQGKDINSLQLPFVVDSKPIKIKGVIKTTETKKQSRGNCSFKSGNILVRYLLLKLTGQDYSQDYQQFKKQLRFQVVEGLVQNYRIIKEQLGEEFVEHLGIKERLEKVAKEKFGKKENGLIVSAKSAIEAFDSDFRLRPEPRPNLKPNSEIRVSYFSCLTRVFLRNTHQ